MGESGFRLDFERSGGFAGLSLPVVSVDESELAPEEIAELERLVAEAASCAPARPPGADRFQYDLTITRGDEVTHLTLGENALDTPVLQGLRDRLVNRARGGE